MGNQIARDLRFYLVLFVLYFPMKVAGGYIPCTCSQGKSHSPQPLMTALFNEVFWISLENNWLKLRDKITELIQPGLIH